MPSKKGSRKILKRKKSFKKLVIVESPAKANTIRKYLGKDYDVKASIGHVRDLPKSKLGVDIENKFALELITIKGKAPIIKELKSAAKKAEKVYLAPDPDREGEAIAQHIYDVIDSPGKVYRIQFNEITKRAVLEAIENPREIDKNKVQAQQARRVLDRIVGYKLSPLLWKKVKSGLSAGRVQSVTMRILIERENEIEAFVTKEYWSIICLLRQDDTPDEGQTFESRLYQIDGKKFEIDSREEATKIVEDIKNERLSIAFVTLKDKKRNSPPPFITSTLQQVASQRFRYAASRTMRVAQKLYEGINIGHGETVGLVTYMRTDSTRTAGEAITEVRNYIESEIGKDFLPEKPNTFKIKKSAQEGHEAIRPTSVLRTPESLKKCLSTDEFRLYELIWKRFVASQMTPGIISTLTVDTTAGRYTLRATGSRIKFPGFLKVYREENENGNNREYKIPDLVEGESIKLLEITPNQHFTQPPPRYSEATLIKELEDKGIGRPSTYASIIGTIHSRDYVQVIERKLQPTELGKLITEALIEHFPQILDIGFTAEMEENLDEIEGGRKNWIELLKEYYEPFDKALKAAEKNMKNYKTDMVTAEICDKCGKPMVEKFGRFGKFLACSGYPECKNTKHIGNKSGDGSHETVKTGEKCPNCDDGEMLIKNSRFGKFLACSNYPQCKTTKPITLGIKCPKGCGGELVERRTKKKRIFYGCANYPACDFTSWEKPFKEKCEKCGSTFMVFNKEINHETIQLKCPNKKCKNIKDIIKNKSGTNTGVTVRE